MSIPLDTTTSANTMIPVRSKLTTIISQYSLDSTEVSTEKKNIHVKNRQRSAKSGIGERIHKIFAESRSKIRYLKKQISKF